jgi:hypothetical protein
MKTPVLPLLFATLFLFACGKTEQRATKVASPSGNITIDFMLSPDGIPHYTVAHNGKSIIDTSALGFDIKDQPRLQAGFEVADTRTSTFREEWEMPWGEQLNVVNHYNELIVFLKEKNSPHRGMSLIFRAFDDGIGFRYELPEQDGQDSLTVMAELTEFQLTGDHTCWWIPGDWDSYEHLYNTTPVSKINATPKANHPNLSQTYIPENAVCTPVTMRAADGTHLSFHEAALLDYPEMTLRIDTNTLRMSSALCSSDRLGYAAKVALPFQTPWRTIQISPNAGGLIESKLILNLNEPNKLGDVSWVKPMKYVGIWWEMHIGRSAWDIESGRHGATTENAKRYIDFAAANNIGGVLVEGWNTGWGHWIGFEEREGIFDFVTPYPDFDLEEVIRYANEKGVAYIMHHETSAAPRTYEKQLDTAYALMKRLGIHTVKTGYVGKIIPKGEYHNGQWMVNHYRKVYDKAAANQVAVNVHEPVKDTGLRRTYPNEISREGLRGQEFNAWANDGGNPPEHLSIVAFTRMLAGPIDFTPGAFELTIPEKPDNQINTTLAHQLALYIVIYSPVQMACDLPEHYEGNPAFQFIRDVGVDWNKTIVLNGEVGDYVTIARQERGTNNWFVGGITDENKRTITVDFSFLDPGLEYAVSIYRDGPDAHYKTKPESIVIEQTTITREMKLAVEVMPGGGFAMSLVKK